MNKGRAIAVTKMPESVPGRIMICEEIIKSMTGNPFFATPDPSLKDFKAKIDALIDAQSEVDAGKAGGTAKRDEAEKAMLLDVSHLVIYVQLIADKYPEQAEQIIESAGMYVKGKGGKKSQSYKVISEKPGEVTLIAETDAMKLPVIWEISSDGSAWTNLKFSRLTTCTVGSLVSGNIYYFRYCKVGEDNEKTPYSQTVTCRVM